MKLITLEKRAGVAGRIAAPPSPPTARRNADMAIFRTILGTGRINAAHLPDELRAVCDICSRPRNRGKHDKCSKIRQRRRMEQCG